MSSNQPVLPHAIIVLNASENDIDPSQWDPYLATDALLDSISRTVFQNTTFKKYAQYWRERKKEIESVKQLMESYYSSIQVIFPTQHFIVPCRLVTGSQDSCGRSTPVDSRTGKEAVYWYQYSLQCFQGSKSIITYAT